jgi:hypothetical protein
MTSHTSAATMPPTSQFELLENMHSLSLMTPGITANPIRINQSFLESNNRDSLKQEAATLRARYLPLVIARNYVVYLTQICV